MSPTRWYRDPIQCLFIAIIFVAVAVGIPPSMRVAAHFAGAVPTEPMQFPETELEPLEVEADMCRYWVEEYGDRRVTEWMLLAAKGQTTSLLIGLELTDAEHPNRAIFESVYRTNRRSLAATESMHREAISEALTEARLACREDGG